jgi:hypothetical protein
MGLRLIEAQLPVCVVVHVALSECKKGCCSKLVLW